MPFNSPISFGPFLVEADGRLSSLSEEIRPSFSFRWRNRLLRADMTPGGILSLRTVLGRVPSTASGRVSDRPQSFGLLRALATQTPDGWAVSLLPDHRALLEASVALPDPVTATSLLTTITDFLLRLAPYLDLIDESGMPADTTSAAA